MPVRGEDGDCSIIAHLLSAAAAAAVAAAAAAATHWGLAPRNVYRAVGGLGIQE